MRLSKKLYHFLFIAALAVAAAAQPASNGASAPAAITLPNAEGSLKMLVTGDTGRGDRPQNELAAVMTRFHGTFKFDLVLLTGDNLYGSEKQKDYKKKFEDVYRTLLDCGVKFFATLGNHDEIAQKNYPGFNMGGREYYSFRKGGASFYALDTNRLSRVQVDWLVNELKQDKAEWKIAFFHHPPFSSGDRHGSELAIRNTLHPIFVEYGVDVVFNGHDHFYERVKPQDGIRYFVSGAGGRVRKGDIEENTGLTEKGFDADLSFMLVEFVGGEMHFQVISRSGSTVDNGVIRNVR